MEDNEHMLLSDAMAFDQAVAGFPSGVQEKLRRYRETDDFCGVIPASDAEFIADRTGWSMNQVMLGLLPFARAYARPPISRFDVGAISQGLSGNLYYGANMEFVGEALSFCVHAEQAAAVNAWVHNETGLRAVAMTAAPCGYCRQFLYELETYSTLEILLPERQPTTLMSLLPDAFGPSDLGARGGLMKTVDHGLALESKDAVVRAALAAANMSYAPYSKGYAGVALGCIDGRIYAGPYAENAAFNPSMSPMEAALAHLNMCGREYREIRQAVLVEVQDSVCSQVDASRKVLGSISQVELVVAYARVNA
jgi:cytidine deaminase